jgi:hypothetical protein
VPGVPIVRVRACRARGVRVRPPERECRLVPARSAAAASPRASELPPGLAGRACLFAAKPAPRRAALALRAAGCFAGSEGRPARCLPRAAGPGRRFAARTRTIVRMEALRLWGCSGLARGWLPGPVGPGSSVRLGRIAQVCDSDGLSRFPARLTKSGPGLVVSPALDTCLQVRVRIHFVGRRRGSCEAVRVCAWRSRWCPSILGQQNLAYRPP